ncbi:MAG: PLDc_N domain-containing protein [Bacteroidaceae bacterium]|nr:PLDc_N domain-containing protein [Bacteroidaceae bacterium]
MIVIILFVLIILSDILTLKDILSRNIDSSMKVFWSIVVLAIPVIGMSIYYFTKR